MRKLFVGALLLSCASAASAQTSERKLDPDLSGQTVECSAFSHEADGTWTALKAMPVQRENEVTEIAAGIRLGAGGPKIAGLDVGAMLDRACAP